MNKLATKSKINKADLIDTKPVQTGRGQINKFNVLEDQVSPDAKTRALRRTMLINSLNTGRCTTPQELSQRFEELFEMCFNNNFIPTVEALALCSRN